MKWNLVVIDDKRHNIEFFEQILADDFYVFGLQDETKFPELLERVYPHALLMDVHMPIIDGHSLYQRILSHPHYNGCPVFFISGDPSDEVKLKAYQEGAMDFFHRSIGYEELVVRLTNKIRFFVDRSTSLELGNLDLDATTMRASLSGTSVDLTLLELRLLSHIVRAFPRNLSRQELIEKIWGLDPVKPGTINTHLTNLKSKLEAWDYIIKVREENLLLIQKSKT